MNDIEYLIEKITKAITFAFKEDGTAPGLTIAWLHHKKEFYTSIVRWSDGEKIVVCSYSNRVLLTALQGLAGKFLVAHKPTKSPIDELAEVVGDGTEQETFAFSPYFQ
jgi:hypothetical protein